MPRHKVMLHVIMPKQISGPNNAVRRIQESTLAASYDFSLATQHFHAGGKINVKLIMDLRRQIKAADPDLIHLSGLQSSGFHAIVAARLASRAPVLVTIRGFSGDALNLSRSRRAIFSYVVEPLTLALSTHFLTVTRAAGRRRMVRGFRRKYLGELHNAAPNWDVGPLTADQRHRLRRDLNLPEGFIATVTGRVVLDKGISTILDVAARLPENMSICLVGDGPMLEDIRRDHAHVVDSGQLILLGSRSDVRDILMASDAFLFATLHENLSNALLEAMAVGLPTVVTDVGGNPEVVVHGSTGYLVQPGDASAMLHHLVALSSDRDLCGRLGTAGRVRVRSEFSQDHLYGQLASIYDNMLGKDGQ